MFGTKIQKIIQTHGSFTQGIIEGIRIQADFQWMVTSFGQHGRGEIGEMMGPVSGFVLDYNSTRLYIAGDTIWCSQIEQALNDFNPHYVIVNAAAAQFLKGDPITMTASDVVKVCRTISSSQVIAVHI